MPTRTLRAKPAAATPQKDYLQAIAYHSSAITIFWILFLFLSLGFVFLFLVQYAKIEMLMQDVAALNEQLVKTQRAVISLQQRVPALQVAVPTMEEAPIASTSSAALIPAGPAYSGILTRGAFSPDGTKYAGYDDVTKGKLGIGVETLADKRVRRVVLFTAAESSGAGTTKESLMSVSWKDNSTIMYNVLVNKTTIETRTVKIGF